MRFPYIKSETALTVIVDGVPHNIEVVHPNYEVVLEIVTSERDVEPEVLLAGMQPIGEIGRICDIGDTSFSVEHGDVYCTVATETFALPANVAKEIIRVYNSEGNLKPLLKFVTKLVQNPTENAIDELYGFIATCGLAITKAGNFLAYKSVRDDFTDHHTGTMDNSIGTKVSMPRSRVDTNKNRTCSNGLHFAAWKYASAFGGSSSRLVVVSVNPKDVVSIPIDYNNEKGRACKYKIVREVAHPDELKTQAVWDDQEEDEDY